MFRSALLLLACLALPLLLGQAAAAGPAIVVDGTPLVCPQPAVNRSGVTLLPLRPVLDALGAQAEWRPKEKKLQVRRGERLVELWIGTPVAQVDRVPLQLDVPPLLINGTTYIPLRVVARAFEAGVRWDPLAKTITVSTSTLPESAQ
ncbi:MAG: copper amine oxidase N-terminal domain-containing protein [Armatimonadota bacterium]